jgi:nucleoside-diphosphate-sugar epimerase
MKRVLVTGASGFVGRWTLAPLVSRGYDVHVADLIQPEGIPGGVTWHPADLLAPGTSARLVSDIRPSHLLHLAWYAAHGLFWNAPDNIPFVQASLELLRAFREGGGSRAALAGTCAEYDWSQGYCREGVTPLNPATLYGTAKDALRRLLAAYAEVSGLSWAWGRPFLLYGPHEHPQRLVASIVRSLLAGREARLSHGRQLRDFMHVEDVAGAFVAMLDCEVQGPVNIATGTPTSIRELAGRLASALGASHLLRFGAIEAAANDPPVLFGDAQRLTREVGFSPKRDLETGLQQTIDWWRFSGALTEKTD